MSETTSAPPKAGNEAILAARYAGVFFELAEQNGALDEAAGDMSALRLLWDESAEWRRVACDPRLSSEDMAAAAAQVAEKAGFGGLTAAFLAIAARNRRLAFLPGMIAAFLDRLAARRGEATAEVRAARALSPAQREALTASLAGIAGGRVHLSVREDAGLLGGLTVKMGSIFIDASVKSKLDRLERSLLKGAA